MDETITITKKQLEEAVNKNPAWDPIYNYDGLGEGVDLTDLWDDLKEAIEPKEEPKEKDWTVWSARTGRS